jgi:Sulfotransferase domain
MTLRVVGAGLGRTGTHSLKLALEQLLGAPCYHMLEVFGRPQDVPLWQRAVDGDAVPWDDIFGGYSAAVDWPASAFWKPMSEAYPDAVILLSTRSSSDAWYKSANDTIFEAMRHGGPGDDAWSRMVTGMLHRFTPDLSDAAATKAAYERHNADVRATAAPERLVDWQPGDGWQPICDALDVPVPDTPFPHVNTTADFRAMMEAGGPPT